MKDSHDGWNSKAFEPFDVARHTRAPGTIRIFSSRFSVFYWEPTGANICNLGTYSNIFGANMRKCCLHNKMSAFSALRSGTFCYHPNSEIFAAQKFDWVISRDSSSSVSSEDIQKVSTRIQALSHGTYPSRGLCPRWLLFSSILGWDKWGLQSWVMSPVVRSVASSFVRPKL
jgi:hypothetical protein